MRYVNHFLPYLIFQSVIELVLSENHAVENINKLDFTKKSQMSSGQGPMMIKRGADHKSFYSNALYTYFEIFA